MKSFDVAALVTGGASGLGEATTRALAARGAAVTILDLQEERGQALAAELVDQRRALLLVEVGDRDRQAVGVEAAGHCLAEPRGPTGHDRAHAGSLRTAH